MKRETWTVIPQDLGIVVDLTPPVSTLAGAEAGGGALGTSHKLSFDESRLAWLDMNTLYSRLLQYKSVRSYDNFFIPRESIQEILKKCEVRVSSYDSNNPLVIMEAAHRAIRAYLDRFVSRRDRGAERYQLEPGHLFAKDQPVQYRVRTSSEELLKNLALLIKKDAAELKKTCLTQPLPRLHVERHLYSPLALDPESYGVKELKVSPPGLLENEKKLFEGIYEYWASSSTAVSLVKYPNWRLQPSRHSGIEQTTQLIA